MRRGYTTRNRARPVFTGPAYFDHMEALIDRAHRIIHLQVYIFGNDPTAERIVNALLRAAQRGVQLFVMADGYASQGFPRKWIDALQKAGARFRWFEPMFRGRHFYIGRRMHHKVLVVDHVHALVSGRNIADRYTDAGKEPGWYDLALAVEGDAAIQLEMLCCRVWNGTLRPRRDHASPLTDAERRALMRHWPAEDRCSLAVRFNDWIFKRAEITTSYRKMLNTAKHEVWLVSSYFVPGRRLKRAIDGAVRRGVRVRVIAAGPSDIWIAKPAERWLYAWLLRRNVEVYEYQRTILHAKAGVRDGLWATIGSFNLNDLSAYTTLEVNVDVDNAPIAAKLAVEMERLAREECRRVTTRDQQHAGIFERLGWWAAVQALRIMHRLIMINSRHG
jgi:cardiolipin synthase A/B